MTSRSVLPYKEPGSAAASGRLVATPSARADSNHESPLCMSARNVGMKKETITGPEALAAATMDNAVSGNSCRFGGTYYLHLQGRRVSHARNQHAGTFGLIPQYRTTSRLAVASYLETQFRFLTQMLSILTNVIHDFPQSEAAMLLICIRGGARFECESENRPPD
jgi:hypothetical protein